MALKIKHFLSVDNNFKIGLEITSNFLLYFELHLNDILSTDNYIRRPELIEKRNRLSDLDVDVSRFLCLDANQWKT